MYQNRLVNFRHMVTVAVVLISVCCSLGISRAEEKPTLKETVDRLQKQIGASSMSFTYNEKDEETGKALVVDESITYRTSINNGKWTLIQTRKLKSSDKGEVVLLETFESTRICDLKDLDPQEVSVSEYATIEPKEYIKGDKKMYLVEAFTNIELPIVDYTVKYTTTNPKTGETHTETKVIDVFELKTSLEVRFSDETIAKRVAKDLAIVIGLSGAA